MTSPVKKNSLSIPRSKSVFTRPPNNNNNNNINYTLSPSNKKDKYVTNNNSNFKKYQTKPDQQQSMNNLRKGVNLNKIPTVEEEAILKKFEKNRENLCACFGIYELLYSNGLPLKCITHNNLLSLYCEYEKKQLCVCCVYNTTNHKLHRVNPIKNCIKTIEVDNSNLKKKFEKQMQNIEGLYKASLEHSVQLNQIFTSAMNDLITEFEKISILLSEKFESLKLSLIENFQETLSINQLITTEVIFLKNLYQEKNNILFNNNTQQDQPKLLFNHCMLSTLAESEYFDSKTIKSLNKEQIKTSLIGEIYKIREYIMNIRLFKTPTNKN